MDTDSPRGSLLGSEESPLSGLPAGARRVALVVLVGVLAVDVSLQAAEILLFGVGQLDGAGNFLAAWDLVKASLAAVALIFVAWQFRSKTFAAFGAVYFVVATEDLLGFHHAAGHRAAALLRAVVPDVGWVVAHAQPIGQFLVMTLLAVVGFAFIWVWKRPKDHTARRARLVLTGILVTLYFFAGGVDFLGAMLPGKLWPAVEESGERLVMTVSLAYAMGLASVRLRRLLTGDLRMRTLRRSR